MKAIKVLNTNTNITDPNIVVFDEREIDSEALALFNSNNTYAPIFGETRQNSPQSRQRLSVVKITNGKRKIYRQYAGRAISINTNSVGISCNSWQQLCLKNGIDNCVVVTKSWWFPFFWNHSNSATRVSFRIGIIGLALAIAGIVSSIVLS